MSTINYDANRSLFELYGWVNYIIIDYTKVDPLILDAVFDENNREKFLNEIKDFSNRERGVKEALRLDLEAQGRPSSLKSLDFFNSVPNPRNTKILLKVDEATLPRLNNADVLRRFDGSLIEAANSQRLKALISSMAKGAKGDQLTLCLLHERNHLLDQESLPECNKIIYKFTLFGKDN